MALQNAPSLVEYRDLKFLIMDAPSESNVGLYIKELKNHNVTDVVRVCEPTYSIEAMEREQIKVWDWPFPDGDPPPGSVINEWLDLVDFRFKKDPSAAIAVHCVAGLGRAPVLVAIALIESGMEAEDAIQLIRKRRRGAINSRQLVFLRKYRPRQTRTTCSCTLI